MRPGPAEKQGRSTVDSTLRPLSSRPMGSSPAGSKASGRSSVTQGQRGGCLRSPGTGSILLRGLEVVWHRGRPRTGIRRLWAVSRMLPSTCLGLGLPVVRLSPEAGRAGAGERRQHSAAVPGRTRQHSGVEAGQAPSHVTSCSEFSLQTHCWPRTGNNTRAVPEACRVETSSSSQQPPFLSILPAAL